MAEHDADATHTDLIELTSDVVAAYVAHNSISAADLPKLISDVYGAMASLGTGLAATPEPDVQEPVPAVSIRKSLTPRLSDLSR